MLIAQLLDGGNRQHVIYCTLLFTSFVHVNCHYESSTACSHIIIRVITMTRGWKEERSSLCCANGFSFTESEHHTPTARWQVHFPAQRPLWSAPLRVFFPFSRLSTDSVPVSWFGPAAPTAASRVGDGAARSDCQTWHLTVSGSEVTPTRTELTQARSSCSCRFLPLKLFIIWRKLSEGNEISSFWEKKKMKRKMESFTRLEGTRRYGTRTVQASVMVSFVWSPLSLNSIHKNLCNSFLTEMKKCAFF